MNFHYLRQKCLRLLHRNKTADTCRCGGRLARLNSIHHVIAASDRRLIAQREREREHCSFPASRSAGRRGGGIGSGASLTCQGWGCHALPRGRGPLLPLPRPPSLATLPAAVVARVACVVLFRHVHRGKPASTALVNARAGPHAGFCRTVAHRGASAPPALHHRDGAEDRPRRHLRSAFAACVATMGLCICHVQEQKPMWDSRVKDNICGTRYGWDAHKVRDRLQGDEVLSSSHNLIGTRWGAGIGSTLAL